jgi:hypothetical protein
MSWLMGAGHKSEPHPWGECGRSRMHRVCTVLSPTGTAQGRGCSWGWSEGSPGPGKGEACTPGPPLVSRTLWTSAMMPAQTVHKDHGRKPSSECGATTDMRRGTWFCKVIRLGRYQGTQTQPKFRFKNTHQLEASATRPRRGGATPVDLTPRRAAKRSQPSPCTHDDARGTCTSSLSTSRLKLEFPERQ